MENEKDILSRAVIPFMIWDQSIPWLENKMPPVGKCGTCFFIRAIRVATGAKRAMENTGATEMQYICIQAKENSLTQFAFADAEVC